jgi:hypothetical protein
MKKIFSIFAALLFAGSMMAADETSTLSFTAKCNGSGTADDDVVWTVASDGSESNFDNTKGIHYGTGSAAVGYIQLSTSGINGTIKEVVVNASVGSGVTASVSVTVNGDSLKTTGDKTTTAITTTATDYTFTGSAKGEIIVRVAKPSSATKALYVKSIAVTYTPASASDPAIEAENIELGYIRFEGDKYTTTETLTVNGKNLENSISVSTTSTKLTLSTNNLPTAGGDVEVDIESAGAALEEEIVLTSGETTKKVKVLGKLIKKAVAPGTHIDLIPDSNYVDSVTVNTVLGAKLGTSKKLGSVKIMLPANANKLYFFAAAWTGAEGNVLISAPDGITLTSAKISEGKIDVAADAGIAGTETEYFLQSAADEAEYLYEIGLSGVTAASYVTLQSGTAQRFVVWGATAEVGSATAIDNAEAEVKAIKRFENGVLIIEKNGVKYNAQGAVVR